MSFFRLVPKSLTLNDLDRRSYFALFTEFDKPAFQHITASARIELVDQKSASLTANDRYSVEYISGALFIVFSLQ